MKPDYRWIACAGGRALARGQASARPLAVPCRNGGALVVVVVMIATLTLALGSLASTAFQRMRLLRSDSDFARASAIAEAGVSTTFGRLVEDPSLIDATGPAVEADFAGGAYEVFVTKPMNGVLLVTSKGFYRGKHATAAATLAYKLAPEENPTAPTVLGPMGGLMLFANKNLTLSGGILVGLGEFTAHCNGNMLLSGGPNISAGGLSAGGTMTLSGNPQVHLTVGARRLHGDELTTLRGLINASQVTSSTKIAGNWGTTTAATNIAPIVTWPAYFSPVPPIAIAPVANVVDVTLPPLDVNAFKLHAQENTWYYEGNQNITRSWVTADTLRRTGVNVNNNVTLVAPRGGVLFVNGTLEVASDMRIEGMVIATGKVTIGGAATFNNTTPYPAIVSVNSDVIIGGGTTGPTLNGWIYAVSGSVTVGGGAAGCGIIAAQNITVTAGYEIGNFEGHEFISPGEETGGDTDPQPAELKLLSWTR